MNKFIQTIHTDENNNIIGCEYDSTYFSPVIGMLNRNNTFFPSITRIIFNGPFTKVFFADGTSSSVKCSSLDTYSKDSAIAFAVFKRLYGKVGDNGDVSGAGFTTYLHKLVDKHSFDQKAYEEEKAKAMAKKNPPKETKKPAKAPKDSKKAKGKK